MTVSKPRKIESEYQDPLDLIWLGAAARLGIEVKRDPDVFASWDGAGVLRIGTRETLDPDDSLAQLILHELCHALVEGPGSLALPDWGLDMQQRGHRIREYACLRLQAAMTRRFGLRQVLASTTDFRAYYDDLPEDPLHASQDGGVVSELVGDEAIPLARAAWKLANENGWREILDEALVSTASIAHIVQKAAPPDSLWGRFQPSDAPCENAHHSSLH